MLDIKLSNFHNASTFHNEGFTKGDDFRITIDEKFAMMLPLANHPRVVLHGMVLGRCCSSSEIQMCDCVPRSSWGRCSQSARRHGVDF